MPKLTIADTQIHYHVHGEGEPLLLIAGLASDLYTWKKALPKLEKHHKVILFDNRGSGLTETSAAAFSIATLSDDAAALLQAIDIKKAHVVGWSMGGNVAQELALHHPDKVGTLVLMSTFMKEPDRSRFALDVMIHSVREGASLETFMMMMQAWCSTNPAFADKHASWTKEVGRDHLLSIEGFARHLGEGLDAHHARQHRNAVDGVVVEERLDPGIELHLGHQTIVQVVADLREGQGQRLVLGARLQAAVHIEPTVRIERRHQDAEAAAHHGLARVAGDERLTNDGQTLRGIEHVDPGALHDLGDAPSRGHANAAPRGPVERDAERIRARCCPP